MNERAERELMALLESCPAEEVPALPEGVFHLRWRAEDALSAEVDAGGAR